MPMDYFLRRRLWRIAWTLAAIAAAAWAWWRYLPDTLPTALQRQVPRSPDANPVLYKWQDARGQWQITDTPPTDRPYEAVRVDPRTNVVPSVIPGRETPPDRD